MKIKVFIALVRKDLRVFRVPLVVLGLATLGLLTAAFLNAWRWEHDVGHSPSGSPYAIWSYRLRNEQYGGWGMLLTAVIASALGGMAFAVERRERTAQFARLMPVALGFSVFTKLLVSVGVILAALFLNAWLLSGGMESLGETSFRLTASHNWRAILWVGPTLTAFAIAWLMSSFLKSPAISASIGFGCGGGAFLHMRDAVFSAHSSGFAALMGWSTIKGLCALSAITAGAVIFVRRVEP